MATTRPNFNTPGFSEIQDDILERSSIEETVHYSKVNGKFGIHAELKKLAEKSTKEY